MNDYIQHIDPQYLHSEITGKILQGFYVVSNEIGYGIGIDVFKNAMLVELESLGLKCEVDEIINVTYKGSVIGKFPIDILVEDKVNTHLISSGQILREHEVCLSNQLKLSKIEVGLLLNIHIEGSHKRIFYANSTKH